MAKPFSDVTEDDWEGFALVVLETIAQHYVKHFSGVASAIGGRPLNADLVQRFKTQFSLAGNDCLLIYLRSFWNDVIPGATWVKTALSFVETIWKIVRGEYNYWAKSDVVAFVSSAKRCKVEKYPEKFEAALLALKQKCFSGKPLCLHCIPGGDTSKLVTKTKTIWML
jgi:hypothetical protein